MKFRLRRLREAKGITRLDAATEVGMSPSLYNLLENGKRRMNAIHIEQMARLFDVTPARMFETDSTADPMMLEAEDAFRDLTTEEKRIVVNANNANAPGRKGSD
jgi:transcriptional regulator with XRE-family HTH domain